MNANDIAEMIEKQPWHTNANKVAIAIFVRQQQAEIEALKADKLKYAEAVIEAMDEWGSYASDYFKEKWHFLDDYNKWYAIVNELRKAQE